MRLRAKIRRATSVARHLVHGQSVDVALQIASLEIERLSEGGCLLLYLDAGGDCLADTWHETEDQAKEQARFEYEIEPRDWVAAS
ncbi:MAG TPA: hypothetical protein VIV11_23490 [Kofleriaceae bacterium]